MKKSLTIYVISFIINMFLLALIYSYNGKMDTFVWMMTAFQAAIYAVGAVIIHWSTNRGLNY